MRATDNCPHCGRPYPVTDPPTEVRVGGSLRQSMVNIIAAHKDGIALRELAQELYRGERPIARTIPVMIHKANKFLEPQGYRIVSTMGRGSRYYLADLRDHADTIRQCTQHSHY